MPRCGRSHGGDDDHDVGEVTHVVGQAGVVAHQGVVRELARGEDVHHVRRLEIKQTKIVEIQKHYNKISKNSL